jgi:hypothetical protein
MKQLYFCVLLAIFTLFVYGSLQSQNKPLPVNITCRKALITRSYVLQLLNTSNETLSLWLQAKGKTSPFILRGNKMLEFGWAQGYHFDANNLFLIGGDGYDTIKQVMPAIELSPWRIGLSKDGGGLNVSFSKSFLQDQLAKHLKLPIIQKASNALEISLDQMPQIVLEEGSDRIYANVTFQASIFSKVGPIPLAASVSIIPFYNQATGKFGVTQIKVENIDMNLLPKEWFDQATQIVNQILPIVFAKYVIHQLEQKWLINIGKVVDLRTKIIDGRLEIIIL